MGHSFDAAHKACSQLRFSNGLRRRWEEARAEAAIQEAVFLAWLEGARGTAQELRQATMGFLQNQSFEADPALALTVGLWRAAWTIQNELPPLNQKVPQMFRPRPAPAVLATLNREATSWLTASGSVPVHSVALPADPERLQSILKAAGDTTQPASKNAAYVLQQMLSLPLFSHANTATAFLFVKWMLSTRGVEPTGVAVLSYFASQDPNLLPALREDPDLDRWESFLASSLIEGARVGELIARNVQAGQTAHINTKQ